MKRLARQRVTSRVVKHENVQAVVAHMRRIGKLKSFLIKMPDGRMNVYVPLLCASTGEPVYPKIGFKTRYGTVI